MNTEASTAADDVLDVLLEVVELLVELAEPVNEQHDLAHELRINVEARRTPYRFEVGKLALVEQKLAGLHGGLNLFDRAAHGLALLASRDARDVRKLLDCHEARAEKVNAVYDRLRGRMRERERRRDRVECRRFA